MSDVDDLRISAAEAMKKINAGEALFLDVVSSGAGSRSAECPKAPCVSHQKRS